jgi:hypothetical protein
MNELLVGNQRFATVGNVLPTGTAIRVYYVSAHCTISGGSLTLHNALVSSTSTTVYLTLPTDSTGNINEQWDHGVLFPNGVWLDTGCAGTITTIIGYRTCKA